LHGFKSSPQAAKAQELADYIEKNHPDVTFSAPEIPNTPDVAMPFLNQYMNSFKGSECVLVGSSLGGFYATCLAEQLQCKAVLINPAVTLAPYWQNYIGLHQNPYSGVQFTITQEHLQSLQSIAPMHIDKQRYCVLLQMGDEVLNAFEASQKFSGARCMIESGGNHHFVGFKRYLPYIFAWLHWE
jgi:predicted esterase YcpF (UPF0227 family)